MGTVFCTTRVTTTEAAGGAGVVAALLSEVAPPQPLSQPAVAATRVAARARPAGRKRSCMRKEVIELLEDTRVPLARLDATGERADPLYFAAWLCLGRGGRFG